MRGGIAASFRSGYVNGHGADRAKSDSKFKEILFSACGKKLASIPCWHLAAVAGAWAETCACCISDFFSAGCPNAAAYATTIRDFQIASATVVLSAPVHGTRIAVLIGSMQCQDQGGKHGLEYLRVL